MSARLGARLKRLRLAAPAPAVSGGLGRDKPRRILPSTTLSRMAGLDPSYVTLVESGLRSPSRDVVLKLAAALGCSAHERGMLLADAGHWPWTDADERTTELLVGLGEAVAAGDYRPYQQNTPIPIKTGDMMGASCAARIGARPGAGTDGGTDGE